jgi:hypothetical protein
MLRGVEVEAPPQIRIRPRDERGYPILYTSAYNEDGTPNFIMGDPQKVYNCGMGQLCGVCGAFLRDYKTYPFPAWRDPAVYCIGGPVSAEKTGVFNDPPMHKECAEWAMQVCPWMAFKTYKRHAVREGAAKIEGQIHIPDRPPYLVLAEARGFKFDPDDLLFHLKLHRVVHKWVPGNGPLPSAEAMTAYFDKAQALGLQETMKTVFEDMIAHPIMLHQFLQARARLQGKA